MKETGKEGGLGRKHLRVQHSSKKGQNHGESLSLILEE